MKPISASFGFWLLMAVGITCALLGKSECAAIYAVGAVLFNAIKALDKHPESGAGEG